MSNNYLKEIGSVLPDFSFDFYARFIPGIYALLLLYYLEIIQVDIYQINFPLLVLIILLSYSVGHIIQPFSGVIVKTIEDRFKETEEIYRTEKRLNNRPGLLRKVNKAHSEANNMAALVIITALVCCFQFFKHEHFDFLFGTLMIVFTLGMFARVMARRRKIYDLKGATPPKIFGKS